MAKMHTNIQTTVQIDKNWASEFEKNDFVVTDRFAFHVFIDDITGQKQCIVYTDDGNGNGTPIISFGM